MNTRFSSLCLRVVFVVALSLTFHAPPARATGTVLYARPGGDRVGNCHSWATACDLWHALDEVATPGQQIWASEGVYYPSNSNDRFAAFVLNDGVAVYGGFAGSETVLSQRNPGTNVTVLSGDIGTLGTVTDNSYIVVSSSAAGSGTILDGFTIAGGYNPSGDGTGMYIDSGSPTLRNLIFTGNQASLGGGLYNGGSPIVSHVTFSGNSADYGGGMYNTGSPQLSNVSFVSNRASARGGGLYSSAAGEVKLKEVTFISNSADYGGGMDNAGTDKLTGVSFKSNWANLGGGLYAEGNATLTHVTFAGNNALGGGGVYADHPAGLVMKHGAFKRNQSSFTGGGLQLSTSGAYGIPHLSGIAFSGNTSGGQGGGMWNSGGSPQLTKVTFANNTAGTSGGGMYTVTGTPVFTDVSFSGNKSRGNASGEGGGGLFIISSPAELNRVTFSGNTAVLGGGLYDSASGDPGLTNVTFSGNSASADGGAMYDEANSEPTLKYVTMSGNKAATGGAVFTEVGSSPAAFQSIFWANGTQGVYNDFGATFHLDNSTLQGGCPALSGLVCTNVKNTNPLLVPLANNGGFTKTMALTVGSPAIDSVACLAGIKTDQRLVQRPQGLKCDMGAYESVP